MRCGAAAQKMMERVNVLFMVDTLHFLARTGRIGRAAAWAGAVLNVKPVVEHSTSVGETAPFARPRSKAKAVELMLQTMAERVGNSRVHVLVHHADELQDGENLKAEIARRFKCANSTSPSSHRSWGSTPAPVSWLSPSTKTRTQPPVADAVSGERS